MRNLILVLGDQLWFDNPALRGFDASRDQLLMIEAHSEGMQVWSHKARITLFLSAMRHFANALCAKQWPLDYFKLEDSTASFAEKLAQALAKHTPQCVICCEPGEWRMLKILQDVCSQSDVALELREDTHFMTSHAEFAAWAGAPAHASKKPKQLRMEFFYRSLRKKHGVLMNGDEPEGDAWNFDADNRAAYPKTGPGDVAAPAMFAPDAITHEVFALVDKHFANHPASADWKTHFIWPVTREQALLAVDRFIDARLPTFGPYQDAMWTDTPFGWHALISSSLNLHLITPYEVIAKAEKAYRENGLDLSGVEGFIRQILGWREFIRGVYWLDMPQMSEANHYQHARDLPKWYWTGDTQMACMRDTITQTMRYGYAHHIQRLMVTGQFALLAEIAPKAVCDWYLAVYVDAVEWVELPNVVGMALNANAGRFTSKPYIASGQYIKRQSNYCKSCRYDPAVRTGERACPVSALYWRFLDKHEKALAANPRTSLMAGSVRRLGEEERAAIRDYSEKLLQRIDTL